MEDLFLMVLKSPGHIFGPLMLLAGLIAVVICTRATARGGRLAARRALAWSLVPPALGVVGALVGGAIWAGSDQIAADRAQAWMALGCTILFGVFVAVVPAVWSLVLLGRRPGAFA